MERTERPTWDEWGLSVAGAIATRADCTRRQVGALIVETDTHHIISAGYNGAPSGHPGCLTSGACPRGQMSVDSVPHGSSYDTGAGSCIALHAEQNAVIIAGTRARGATLYCTDEPCDGCWRLIIGARIYRVVCPMGERNMEE